MNNLAPMNNYPWVQGNLNWMPGYNSYPYHCIYTNGVKLIEVLVTGIVLVCLTV